MPAATARLEYKPATLFNARAILVVCAFGLLLLLPVILSMLVVSVLPIGFWTLAIPAATIGAATYFLPFGSGNSYVAQLVRPIQPAAPAGPEAFIVQVTFRPRLRSGIRALVEDADDVGWLTVTESLVTFRGDSIQLSLPREQIQGVRAQSIGPRGLFLYPRLVVAVSGLGQARELRIADRSSWVLPEARRRTRELRRRLTGEGARPLSAGD